MIFNRNNYSRAKKEGLEYSQLGEQRDRASDGDRIVIRRLNWSN